MNQVIRFFCIILGLISSDSFASSEIRYSSGAGQCVIDTCGPYQAKFDKSPDRPVEHQRRIDLDYERSLEPMIYKLIAHSDWETRDRLRLIDRLSGLDFKDIDLSPDVRIGLRMQQVIDFVTKYANKGLFEASSDPGKDFVLNRDKGRKFAQAEGLDDVERFLDAVERVLATDLSESFSQVSYLKLSSFYDLYSSSQSYEEFLKEKIKLVSEWAQRFASLNPYLDVPVLAIQRKFERFGLTDSDSQTFLLQWAYAKMAIYAFGLDHIRNALLAIRWNAQAEVQAKLRRIESTIPHLRKNIENRVDDLMVPSIRSECSSRYKESLRSYPLPIEMDRFNDRYLPRVVDAAARAAARMGLARNIPALRAVIWKTPPSYDDGLAALREDLEDRLELKQALRKARDRFWSEFGSGEKRALAHAVYELLLLNVDQLKSAYRDVQDLCKDIKPEEHVDNIYWRRNMAHVGWRSVIYPKEFRFALGHELGHVIFHLEEKSSELKEKLQCLRNRHTALEGVETDTFLNEDFADLFGSLVEKEFSHDQYYQSSICHWRTNPMSRATGEFESTRQDGGDVHSASLFRLIAVGSEMGNLRPSCKAVLQISNTDEWMKSCAAK